VTEIEFYEHDHAYRINGRRVPSVTQVLDHLNDWSQIPAIDLETKRVLGRDVHVACNLLVRGQLDWSSLDPAVRPYVRAAELFLQENICAPLASELRVASPLLGVAGTLDLYAEHHDGGLWYIDWKISETVPSTVGAQTAAYEVLHRCTVDPTFKPWHARPRSKRACVRLGMETYRIEILSYFERDWSTFISCVNNWKHREAKYG
jgi:hypothetical protein